MEQGQDRAEMKSHEAGNKSVEEQKTCPADETSCEKKATSTETTTNQETEARFTRLKLFKKVMQKSLESFVGNVSFTKFTSTFRPLHERNPQRMETIYEMFIGELRKTIQNDINTLIEEGCLETKLNELDKLENSSKKESDPAWRPSGIPEQDLCSFLKPFYQKQETYMRRELQKLQAENAALAQKVIAGRERISQTESQISAAVEDWKATVTEFEEMAFTLCSSDVSDVNGI